MNKLTPSLPSANTSVVAADLFEAVTALQAFSGSGLGSRLASIELSIEGATVDTCATLLAFHGATNKTLGAAGLLKPLVGQINVTIHALGILLCLPHLLEEGEVIEYVSLGAGNSGKQFDLESDRRIAEFKFISWRGGPEAIRQNGVFKDFYTLAEHDTHKRKYLYVLGMEHPLTFLNGRRALSSVLKDHSLHQAFIAKFGDQYRVVRDYYLPRRDSVNIVDISDFLPELLGLNPDP